MLPVVYGFTILSIGFTFLMLVTTVYPKILLILLLCDIGFIYIIAELHREANIYICWNTIGLQIYENKTHQDIRWDELRYKYYSHDFKGHQYLILSRIELEKRDIRKETNYFSAKARICFDHGCVIPLSWTQPQLVEELVQFVDDLPELRK